MKRLAAIVGLGVLLAGCGPAPKPTPPPADRLTLVPTQTGSLPGWADDQLGDSGQALARSCARIAKLAPDAAIGPDPRFGKAADWQAGCAALTAAGTDGNRLRQVLEQDFLPLAAGNNDKREGLFTGYYEPSLKASRVRTAQYAVPILARPDDLVMVELGQFRDALKGQRIAGRVENGRLVPYPDRSAIEAGALGAKAKVLYWANDPIDVFFLQIQGSGRVEFPDGTTGRIGYDAQNGHPYVAIGKVLVERGALPKDGVTMQSIRAWLQAHPEAQGDILRQNPSYVFFRDLKGDAAIGGEGVGLTPGRSLAVDRKFHAYGVPIWLATTRPDGTALRRLVVAQDTGGAITGPVRGDVFWGPGAEAADLAGKMQQRGEFWLFLPRDLALRAAS